MVRLPINFSTSRREGICSSLLWNRAVQLKWHSVSDASYGWA